MFWSLLGIEHWSVEQKAESTHTKFNLAWFHIKLCPQFRISPPSPNSLAMWSAHQNINEMIYPKWKCFCITEICWEKWQTENCLYRTAGPKYQTETLSFTPQRITPLGENAAIFKVKSVLWKEDEQCVVRRSNAASKYFSFNYLFFKLRVCTFLKSN